MTWNKDRKQTIYGHEVGTDDTQQNPDSHQLELKIYFNSSQILINLHDKSYVLNKENEANKSKNVWKI